MFYKVLSETDRAAISFLRDTRNAWAHNNKSFSLDETHRVVDMAHMLLSDCAAVEQAAALDEQRQEVLRLKFEEQTKRQAAKSAESLAVQGAVGGLRPWREVVEPHDGRGQRHVTSSPSSPPTSARSTLGEGSRRVRRPGRVLPPHLPDRGLRTLLVQTMRRINGNGGDPVVELQTNFGGGKTHSMLALYHLVSAAPRSTELAGMTRCSPRRSGVEACRPGVKRAVIVGNDFSPRGVASRPTAPVSTRCGASWPGSSAGKDAYEQRRGDDETRTNPGDHASRELLAAYAPCIDADRRVGRLRPPAVRIETTCRPAGFETHMTFAQALTEAAKAVAQLPARRLDPRVRSVRRRRRAQPNEVGGVGGVEALERLRSVVHRVESPWQPASADESFEIVRRRLFKPIPTDDWSQRDVTCRRFADMYRASTRPSSRSRSVATTTSSGSRPLTRFTRSSSTGFIRTGRRWSGSSAPAACCG